MALFGKDTSLVCIELVGDVARFIELKSLNPLVVKRYGERDIPEGMNEEGAIADQILFKQFVQKSLDEWNIKKKKIAFIQSNETVIVKKIVVPKDIPHDEIHGYIYLELGVTVHLPFEHPAMDFVVLDEVEEGQEILLVATREDMVTTSSDAFKYKKNEAIIADIAPLCFYRLYDFVNDHPEPEEIMIVDVDSKNATISIFENHIPVFMQYEELVLEQNNWMMNEMHEVDYHEDDSYQEANMVASFGDLLDSIDRINHFYRFSLSNQKEVKKIVIVGDNPWLDRLVELGNNRDTILFERIDDQAMTMDDELLPREYQVLLGLALRVV